MRWRRDRWFVAERQGEVRGWFGEIGRRDEPNRDDSFPYWIQRVLNHFGLGNAMESAKFGEILVQNEEWI